MSNLNQQQFARYSAIEVPHPVLEYEFKPLPASMERHGHRSYQPTLPGMENMLPGEQTHTDVLFHHPNAADPDNGYEVPGSHWGNARVFLPKHVNSPVSSLRPTQDWLDEGHLHNPREPHLPYHEEGRPLVEEIKSKNVVHDGHHRIARAILQGEKNISVAKWNGRK